jgi:hypothetical protein
MKFKEKYYRSNQSNPLRDLFDNVRKLDMFAHPVYLTF